MLLKICRSFKARYCSLSSQSMDWWITCRRMRRRGYCHLDLQLCDQYSRYSHRRRRLFLSHAINQRDFVQLGGSTPNHLSRNTCWRLDFHEELKVLISQYFECPWSLLVSKQNNWFTATQTILSGSQLLVLGRTACSLGCIIWYHYPLSNSGFTGPSTIDQVAFTRRYCQFLRSNTPGGQENVVDQLRAIHRGVVDDSQHLRNRSNTEKIRITSGVKD